MNLDELAVRVFRALLVAGGDGAAGADHRVRRLAEDQTRSTGRDDHGVGRKRFQLERLQVHRDQAAAHLMVVENERQHFPVLELSDLAADFVTAHLLVERVKKLLAGRGAGESRAVMFRAAEAAEVEQSLPSSERTERPCDRTGR